MTSRVAEYGGKTDKYEWQQTKDEVTVTVQVPPNLKAKDIDCKIERHQITFGLKGQDPLIKGQYPKPVKKSDSTWTKDGNTVEITLSKEMKKEEDWWDCLVVEDKDKEGGSIDAELIEASKYLDDSLLKKVKEKKLADKMAAQAGSAAINSASASTETTASSTPTPEASTTSS